MTRVDGARLTIASIWEAAVAERGRRAVPAAGDVPGSRRAGNKARTTAAILDAARACIGEGGVQTITMDQIAAAADVSRATLFNYFQSKSDILEALVEENERGFYRAIEAWRRADASRDV